MSDHRATTRAKQRQSGAGGRSDRHASECRRQSPGVLSRRRRRVAGNASCDLRRGRDRRLHRVFPEPEAGRGRGRRAHRGRLRRIGEIRRVPRARLVRRLAAWATRPQELRASCRARQRVRWQVGLSAAGGARRRGQRPAPAGLGRPTLAAPDWVTREAIVHQRLGTLATTAQVHPAEFTKGMMEAAIARGARLQIGWSAWSSTAVAGAFAASWSRAS